MNRALRRSAACRHACRFCNLPDMDNSQLINAFRDIVGRRHVLTGLRATERFRRGFRSGEGEALCVVQPGSLLEQWRVLQACVAADKIVIMQAANTGLTEGSTPSGSYDRDVVLINTRRMDRIVPIDDGRQVIGFPGATLFGLEKLLAPLGREPHSVIGSSCIGASVVGGVCNNSGGSLVERGPSYTELSLFAQVDATGQLQLVNHLGLDLGSDPEDMLTRGWRQAILPLSPAIAEHLTQNTRCRCAMWTRRARRGLMPISGVFMRRQDVQENLVCSRCDWTLMPNRTLPAYSTLARIMWPI